MCFPALAGMTKIVVVDYFFDLGDVQVCRVRTNEDAKC